MPSEGEARFLRARKLIQIKKERCVEGFGENALTRDTVWRAQA
jgi:hypothetical protein